MNIKDYSGVLVYIEQRYHEVQNVSLELLGKGRKIADELGVKVVAAIAGHQIEKHSKLLVEYGADKVVVLNHEALELYSTEPYTQAMVQVIRTEMPEIVLFGAPFDSTTSYRPGTRFASRTMRAESYGLETFSPYLDLALLCHKYS